MKINGATTVFLTILLALALSGCATGPTLYTSAQNTPAAHPENKVLFVDLLDWHGKPNRYQYVDLKYGFELEYADSDAKTEDRIPFKDIIQKNDEFSIILNAVWIPNLPRKSFFSTFLCWVGLEDPGRDIAVILDIIAENGETKPLVVAYQRGVQGGHLLNFKNIVVYNTSSWDGIHQPYFHLRILDVSSERNKNTQELLDSAATSVNSLAGIVPSAYFPHISQAIKTSKYILGNKMNEILLDYKIQFFNLSLTDEQIGITQSVNQVLDRFAQGNWIALGRPEYTSPVFWDSSFKYNRKTQQIHRIESDNKNNSRSDIAPPEKEKNRLEVLDVPYVSMVVVKRDYGVSKQILEHFNELSQLILNGESKTNSEGVSLIAKGLQEYAEVVKTENETKLDIKEYGQESTSTTRKEALLTALVRKYINARYYNERESLFEEVASRYGISIRELITRDQQGREIPNSEAIKAVVNPK